MHRVLQQGFIGLTLLAAPVVAIAQQAPDPLLGIRALNVAESTLPEAWALRSVVLAYEADGDALKATWTGTRVDGTVPTIRFTARFDGRDYPAVGTTSGDSIALERLDPFNIDASRKKAGAFAGTLRLVLSEGGAVLTVTERDVSGTQVAVPTYERQ